MCAENYERGIVWQFKRELLSHTKHTRTEDQIGVLSSEGLSGAPRSGYRNFRVVFQMLRDATTEYNVKIVIYLRRQDLFVESMYTQTIHEGCTSDFPSFLKDFDSPDALDYCGMLNELATYFGDQNVIVRSYENASERGLIDDFSEVINSKLLLHTRRERHNPSFSRNALEISRIAYPHLGRQQKRELRRALQTAMPKHKGEDFSFLSKKERAEFLEKYELCNSEISERYLNRNAATFFPSRDISCSSPNVLAYQEVAGLVVELFHGNVTAHQSGIIAGARVAVSGYPRIKKFLRRALRRH